MFKLKLNVSLDRETKSYLARIAGALERIEDILAPKPVRFQLFLENLMPVYPQTKEDFDWRVRIAGFDAEGGFNPDSPVPDGYTLTVTSDNPLAFEATQDEADPRVVHSHVGSATNPDGTTPSVANVSANLFDPAGELVATGAAQVTVVVDTAVEITEIVLALPAGIEVPTPTSAGKKAKKRK